MRNAALLALGTYVVALVLLVPAWGNHGLWLAIMVLMLARAVWLAVYYPHLARDVARTA